MPERVKCCTTEGSFSRPSKRSLAPRKVFGYSALRGIRRWHWRGFRNVLERFGFDQRSPWYVTDPQSKSGILSLANVVSPCSKCRQGNAIVQGVRSRQRNPSNQSIKAPKHQGTNGSKDRKDQRTKGSVQLRWRCQDYLSHTAPPLLCKKKGVSMVGIYVKKNASKSPTVDVYLLYLLAMSDVK